MRDPDAGATCRPAQCASPWSGAKGLHHGGLLGEVDGPLWSTRVNLNIPKHGDRTLTSIAQPRVQGCTRNAELCGLPSIIDIASVARIPYRSEREEPREYHSMA